MRIVFALATPLLVAPFVTTMLLAVQSFQHGYSETLCRMESVRVHAIENIERNEPIVANFGGDACLTPVLPTVDLQLDDLGDAPATPTPVLPAP